MHESTESGIPWSNVLYGEEMKCPATSIRGRFDECVSSSFNEGIIAS